MFSLRRRRLLVTDQDRAGQSVPGARIRLRFLIGRVFLRVRG